MSHKSDIEPEEDSSEHDIDAFLADWRDRLRQPSRWAAQFERLREAVATVDENASTGECAEIEPLLQDYVDRIQRGVDSGADYSEVHAHLDSCEACRHKAEWLLAALSDPAGPAHTLPDASASLPGTGPTPDWTIGFRRPIGKPQQGLVIRFAPAFIAARYQQASMLHVRGAGEAPQSTLLLTEPVVFDDEPWLVQISTNPQDAASERVRLCAKIVCDHARPLRVTLRWGEHVYAQVAPSDSPICFDDLDAHVLQEPAPAVQVDIDISANPVPGA